MRDDNCIFCKIANGEIPSATLYEDEDFRVILDLGPASKGHALILPKEHAANLYELPDELAAKAMVVAKKRSGKGTELRRPECSAEQRRGRGADRFPFPYPSDPPIQGRREAGEADLGAGQADR